MGKTQKSLLFLEEALAFLIESNFSKYRNSRINNLTDVFNNALDSSDPLIYFPPKLACEEPYNPAIFGDNTDTDETMDEEDSEEEFENEFLENIIL